MAIRHVKSELEAKLKAVKPGFFSSPSGKIERKSYEDGGERLKISLRKLKVPDRSTAIVTVDGQEIAQVELTNGSGRFDRKVEDESLPTLSANQRVEVLIDGAAVLAGQLYID